MKGDDTFHKWAPGTVLRVGSTLPRHGLIGPNGLPDTAGRATQRISYADGCVVRTSIVSS